MFSIVLRTAVYNNINFDRLNPTWRSVETAKVFPSPLFYRIASVLEHDQNRKPYLTWLTMTVWNSKLAAVLNDFRKRPKSIFKTAASTARGESDVQQPKAALIGIVCILPSTNGIKGTIRSSVVRVKFSHRHFYSGFYR